MSDEIPTFGKPIEPVDEVPAFGKVIDEVPSFAQPITDTPPVDASNEIPSFGKPIDAIPEFGKPIVEETSVFDEILEGAQQSLAPTTMSEEEFNSGGTAKLVGQIGADFAAYTAAAKVGAVVGSVVPGVGTAIGAVAAPLALSAYKIIATELAAMEAQDREVSISNLITGAAAELNPLSKGSKAMKALRQVGANAAETYSQTGDAKSAALAGALGGGMMWMFTPAGRQSMRTQLSNHMDQPTDGLTKLNTKNFTKHDEAVIKEMAKDNENISIMAMEALEKKGPEYLKIPAHIDILMSTGKKPKRTSTTELIDRNMDEDISYFGRTILQLPLNGTPLNSKQLKQVKKVAGTWSREKQQTIFEQARWSQESMKAASKLRTATQNKLAQNLDTEASQSAQALFKDPQDTTIMSWMKNLVDPLFLARSADKEVMGLDLESTLSQYSRAENAFSAEAQPFTKRASDLVDRFKKVNITDNKLVDIIEGRTPINKVKDQAVVDLVSDVKTWLGDIREFQQSKGRVIGEVENYFPRVKLKPAQMKLALEDQLKVILKDYGQNPQDVFKGKGTEATKEFMSVIKTINPAVKPNLGSVKKTIANMLNKESISKLDKIDIEGNAAFSRQLDQVPAFAREMDLGENLLQYINVNLKPLYYRDAVDSMNRQLGVLNSLGMDTTKEYFDKFAQQMAGSKSSYRANRDIATNKLKYNGLLQQRMGNKFKGDMMLYGSDLMSWTVSQFYPNVLGWRIDAPVRNMSQNWTMTAPEIGGTYGYKVTGKSYPKALNTIRKNGSMKQNYSIMKQFLQDKGYTPADYTGEGKKIVANSLKDVPFVGKSLKSIEFVSELGMTMYEYSDISNRFITYHSGMQVGKDIMAGVPDAMKFLSKASGGLKTNIRLAQKRGASEDEVGKMVADYLMSKTQFNYGKTGMNAFGREYGQIVSMFSKWPAAVGSDMAEMIKEKRGMEALNRYLAPIAFLGGIEYMLDEMGVADDPLKKAVLGRNMMLWSPGGSPFVTSMPPLISTPMKVFEGMKDVVFNGEIEMGAMKIKKAVTPMIPGIGQAAAVYDRTKRYMED